MAQKRVKEATGYKATDKNMQCRGFQFEIGKWYEADGDLELCKNGFHFCEFPSGPWSYYTEGRLFKVKAEDILLDDGPGADLKHVARKIMLVEEIKIDGYRNTGDRNTGDGNTGDRNTGDGNTGNGHSGSLCFGEPVFYLFNKKTDRKNVDFSLVSKLAELLSEDKVIDPEPFCLCQTQLGKLSKNCTNLTLKRDETERGENKMAQKRLKVVYRLEYDYGGYGWMWAWSIRHGNESLCIGTRTYSTKSNLFRGIRRAMEKLGITASGSMPLFPVYYDIVEDK